MRTLRLFAYFLVGVLLAASAGLASATTTYTATGYWSIGGVTGTTKETGATRYCSLYGKALQSFSPNDNISGPVTFVCVGGQTGSFQFSWTCPNGGTLANGGVNQCVNAPDCPAGQVRNTTTGVCGAPPCTAGESGPADYFGGWRIGSSANALVGPDGGAYAVPPPSTVCNGTCTLTVSSSGTCSSSSTPYVDTPQQVNCHGTGITTGASCSTSSALPTGSPPVIPTHKPKCLASEGVLTSSSGTVACVPSATPGKETPVVTTSKKVETFGDGTTKTTETTKTVVPSDGTADTTTKQTSTGGQSGTAGTSESSQADSKSDTGKDPAKPQKDDACDPAKDFCGTPGTAGLYEKKSVTVQGVLTTFSNGVKATPAGAAMTSFFTLSTPGGACPNWQVAVPLLNVTVNLSQYFCTQEAINMMNLVGAVLLAVASFVGFRWAIL